MSHSDYEPSDGTFWHHPGQVAAQDLLHEGAGHLPRLLLLDGVRGAAGVRHGELHRQADQAEPAAVGGVQQARVRAGQGDAGAGRGRGPAPHHHQQYRVELETKVHPKVRNHREGPY